jgi:soluble lytic murein transglycosylase-like protein
LASVIAIGGDPPDPATALRLVQERLAGMNAGKTWRATSGGARDIPSAEIDELIKQASARAGLDTNLVRAVVAVESGYNNNAVSSAGAKGLMQLMDGTARQLGVSDSFDPAENLRGGTDYLRFLLDKFGDEKLALAAYNAGPNAVQRYGGIPPYAETRRYVSAVLSQRENLRTWEG